MANMDSTMKLNRLTVMCLLVVAGSCFGSTGASGAPSLKPQCPANFSSVYNENLHACRGNIRDPTACCETAVILQDEILLTPYENFPADVKKITGEKRLNKACRRQFQRALHARNVTVNIFRLCNYVPLFLDVENVLRENTCIYKSMKDISAHVQLSALAKRCSNKFACKPELNSPSACGGRILTEANKFHPQSKRELEDCYIAIISRLAQRFFAQTYKTLYDVCPGQSQYSYPPGLNPASAPTLSQTAAEAPSIFSRAPPPESGGSTTQAQHAHQGPPPPSGLPSSAAVSSRIGHVSAVISVFGLIVMMLASQ